MTTDPSRITPPTEPSAAAEHFAGRLAVETDVSDVHADLLAGLPGLLVVDSRSRDAWDQGHVRGAVHCPTAEIPARGRDLLEPTTTVVVVYCWGPGCNGATRAALAFARLGVPVKEMIGGFEYWAREGFPVDGGHARSVDPLTTVVGR